MATYIGTNGVDAPGGGFDYLYGADGDDTLFSDRAGLDVVEGGRGNDSVYIASGNNGTGHLYGGDGNDRVFGGENGDSMYGGEGDDLVVGSNFFVATTPTQAIPASGNDFLDGGNGVDALYGFDGADTLYGGEGNDAGTITVLGVVHNAGLFGGSGADFLDGGRGNDYLDGGSDNDRLIGGEGIDTLIGGTGSDVMSGGADADTYVVDNLGDIVNESNESGIDTVYASVDYKLGAFQDNLIMFGASAYGTGNAGDNYITGNASNNVINGQAGLDHLAGGGGSDIFQMVGNWGVQIITDFVAGAGTQDAVAFASNYIKSFADVLSHSSQIGGDTYIGDGQGDLVVLTGVTIAQLHPDDFAFFS